MNFYAVLYTYVDDPTALDAARVAHRAFLGGLYDRGIVALAGPLLPGAPTAGGGGLILVRAADPTEAATVLDPDPFATQGLIATRQIQPFTQIYGTLPLTQ